MSYFVQIRLKLCKSRALEDEDHFTLFDYQLSAAVTHFPSFKHLGFGLFIVLHGGSGGR